MQPFPVNATTRSASAANPIATALIDGGGGIDTVLMGGKRSDFFVTVNQDTHVMTIIAPRQTLVVTSFERLRYSDTAVAYDLDGNAGTVARVLGAVYGAVALHNAAYVGQGLSLLDDASHDYAQLLQLAVQKRLGSVVPDHGAVVDLLFTNVFGNAPEAATRARFVGQLDSGAHTVASLAMLAAESQQNLVNIDLVGLGITGLEYTHVPPTQF